MTKEKPERSYRREAIMCVVVAVLGWFWLGIIIEPLVLWRGVYVVKHTDGEATKNIATVASIMAGTTIAVMVATGLMVAIHK